MKKITILFVLTVCLMASPMPEQQALDLFASIKKSEYNWAVAQWENEMHIKTRSRSSARTSDWEHKNKWEPPFDRRVHDPLRTLPDTTVDTAPPVDPVTVPDIQ